MFQYATLGILIVKNDGTIVKANPFAEKLFGYDPSELEGQYVEVLVPDAFRGDHAQHRHSYHQKPKERIMGANLDLFAKRKDGASFPVEISLGHAEFEGEKMAIAYVNNISTRKKGEEKLRHYAKALEGSNKELQRSKRLLKEAQKLTHIGHFEWDIPSNSIHWSDELYRIYGYKPQSFEVTLDFIFENIHSDDRQMIKDYVDRVRKDKIALSFEYRIVTKSGEIRHLDSTREVALDKKGNLLRLFGTIRDVTKKKVQEEELRVKDMAISSALLPIAFADLSGKITFVNQAFLNLWGFDTASEVIGRSNAELGTSSEKVQEIMQSIRETGSWSGEDTAKKKDGSPIDIFVSSSLVNDENGQPFCTLGTFLDITELKKAQAYNHDISRIVEESLNEIFIFDAKSLKFIQVNLGGRKNLGYTEKELQQITPVDIKPEFTKKKFLKTIQPLLDGKETRLIFFTIHERKDKTTYPVEVHLQYASLGGQPVFVAFINDISERKKAEIAIQQEKETAQMYLDIAGSLTVVIDKEENIALLNQRGAEILGVFEKEVLNKNWFDLFIPKSDRKKVRKVFDRLIHNKDKNVEYFENYVLTKNGDKRLIWWHNRVLIGKRGEVQGTISSGVDITEQRQAEKSLEESRLKLENYAEELAIKVKERTADLAKSEKKLNQAQAIAKIGHWDLFVESNKLEISKGMYQIFGLKSDTPISSELIDSLNHIDDRHMVRDTFKKVIATKKEILISHRLITPDGALKYVLSNIQAPVFDEKGKLTRLFGVVKDITSLKEAELQLHEALQKEKELGILKSRFVSMASHEFRTPLSSILSSAELLGMYIEAGKMEKTGRNINRIKNSVRNLTGILNDFLSLEKLEAGKVEVQSTSINLVDYLEELTEEIKPILRPEQQLLFDTNQLEILQTDPYLLKNILINLISNAIKYSPKGENVTLAISKEKEQLIFKVIDKGIGIPDEDKTHMFTRFFRASNVENIKGTGLGLTIVKRYLDLMGGDIGFESEYGKGSTFYFELPV